MNKLILVLLALLVATGCDFVDHDQKGFEPSLVHGRDLSKEPKGLLFPARLQISSEFTAEEQEALVAAVDLWRTSTSDAVRLEVVIGDDPTEPCRAHLGTYPPQPEGSILGESVDGGRQLECELVLSRDGIEGSAKKHKVTYAKAFEQVATHELGHIFGLGHLEDGVMFWAFDPANFGVDDLALNAFCSMRGGCPSALVSK